MQGAIHIALGGATELAREASGSSLNWLSTAEQHRLSRITAPSRRDQFIAARWLARRLLAAAGGGDPLDWSLSAPDNGPPLAHGPMPGLHVGLSHSGDRVACAVGNVPLGLDLELPRRRRDFLALADVICSPVERGLLEDAQGAAREEMFYRFWTLKEAWLKLRGEDLAPARLAQIEVQPAGERPASARVWIEGEITLALVAPTEYPVHWAGTAPGAPALWAITDQQAAWSQPG